MSINKKPPLGGKDYHKRVKELPKGGCRGGLRVLYLIHRILARVLTITTKPCILEIVNQGKDYSMVKMSKVVIEATEYNHDLIKSMEDL